MLATVSIEACSEPAKAYVPYHSGGSDFSLPQILTPSSHDALMLARIYPACTNDTQPQVILMLSMQVPPWQSKSSFTCTYPESYCSMINM